jgi:hypothetical protein
MRTQETGRRFPRTCPLADYADTEAGLGTGIGLSSALLERVCCAWLGEKEAEELLALLNGTCRSHGALAQQWAM